MTLPISSLIESPILQELSAVGGTDDVRFVYERLIRYFPSLSDAEVSQIQNGENTSWKKAVQKAGRSLDEKKLILRERGIWKITQTGSENVQSENSDFTVTKNISIPLDHPTIQKLLCEIGRILGYFAETEFEFYDVIWRETETSKRISHVFEVQSRGNIDSAFAKLKRAFDAQRSKPFLILASERDTNRANKSLENEFRELSNVISILSFVEIRKTFENLTEIKNILPKLLDG
ncbi:hypothetical protein BH20ACI4_BH20ACI4_00730 [soil metagenome]